MLYSKNSCCTVKTVAVQLKTVAVQLKTVAVQIKNSFSTVKNSMLYSLKKSNPSHWYLPLVICFTGIYFNELKMWDWDLGGYGRRGGGWLTYRLISEQEIFYKILFFDIFFKYISLFIWIKNKRKHYKVYRGIKSITKDY